MKHFNSSTVTVMVSDMGLAVSFYTEILGFELRKKYGDHYAEIEAPGLLIGLHPSDREVKLGDNMSMGYGTKDLDSTVAYMRTKGIQLTVKEDGPVRIAHFTDPDKNPLYAIEI